MFKLTLNFPSKKEADILLLKIKEVYGEVLFDGELNAGIPAVVPTVPIVPPVPEVKSPLFVYDFKNIPDGLITNEFSHWNPADPKRLVSTDWEMDSGSLFSKSGWGWSGVPDAPTVVPYNSVGGNNSAIFRLVTKRRDFKDVSVKFKLNVKAFSATPKTPAQDYDGVHIFLRYQSQYHLYYASISRRDGACVIKKKVPVGPSNGGTYTHLAPSNYQKFPIDWMNKTRDIEATIKTQSDGKVLIRLFADGVKLVEGLDDNTGNAPPILAAGATGIRGDNTDFTFNPFQVDAI